MCFNLKLDHLLSARNDGNNFRVLPSGSLELQVYLLDSTICHNITSCKDTFFLSIMRLAILIIIIVTT